LTWYYQVWFNGSMTNTEPGTYGQYIRETQVAWRIAGPFPRTLDETVTVGTAKLLIAQDSTDKRTIELNIKDLANGNIVYLQDKTCLRFDRKARTIRHWL
jgi:hypothetical protein